MQVTAGPDDPSHPWLLQALKVWAKPCGVFRVCACGKTGGTPAGAGWAGREDRPWALAVIDGELVFRTQAWTERLGASEVAVLAAGTAFRLQVPERAETLLIFADGQGLSVQWQHFDRKGGRPSHACSDRSHLAPIMSSLLATLAGTRLDESARQAGWIFAVALLGQVDLVDRRLSGGDPLACQACERIEAGYADPALDVNLLAAELGVHRSTLLRAFHRQGVGTPQELLTRHRIDRAQELLRTTSLDAAAVARRSGFSSRTVFLRAFRRQVGFAPSDYRRLGHHDGQRGSPRRSLRDQGTATADGKTSDGNRT